jgi:hypothetical protein
MAKKKLAKSKLFLTFNKIRCDAPVPVGHALHIDTLLGTKGMWNETKVKLQQLAINIAYIYVEHATKNYFTDENLVGHLERYETYLTSISAISNHAVKLLQLFFDIETRGCNIRAESGREGHAQPTILKLKPLGSEMLDEIIDFFRDNRVKFVPAKIPDLSIEKDVSRTKLYVRGFNAKDVIKRLCKEGHGSYAPLVIWLCSKRNGTIDLYSKPSGQLRQRFTSVAPIRNIENMPSWLRTALFGASADVDGAMAQANLNFVDETLQSDLVKSREVAANEYCEKKGLPHFFVYNDGRIVLPEGISDKDAIKWFPLHLFKNELEAMINDKRAYRLSFLKVLELEDTPENMADVKSIINGILNGANCTPDMLKSKSVRYSLLTQLVKEMIKDSPKFVELRKTVSWFEYCKVRDAKFDEVGSFIHKKVIIVREAQKVIAEHFALKEKNLYQKCQFKRWSKYGKLAIKPMYENEDQSILKFDNDTQELKLADKYHELVDELQNAKKIKRKQRRRMIFAAFFKWERYARELIIAFFGNTGAHLHDGVDGIVTNEDPALLRNTFAQMTGIYMTVKPA